MALVPRTPLFSTTTASRNISQGFLEVDVSVGGAPLRFVSITPNTVPATNHEIGVNASSPALTHGTSAAYEIDFRGFSPDVENPTLIWKVYVKAGLDATTFTIQGHV